MLTQIIEQTQKCILRAKKKLPQQELAEKCKQRQEIAGRDFKYAISKRADINLIAEIKKASPSRGVICKDFSPEDIAKTYQLNGAAALSILTEEKFFQGSINFIKNVKRVCSLPILRKDFIIDEYQIFESSFYGADAILLIANILSEEQIKTYKDIASSLKMDSLIEAHSEEDLNKALSAEADIIGINNRDLQSFKLNLKTAENLIGLIPEGKIIVIESGIKTNSDLMFLKTLGANAVLIGEAFMESEDIGKKVREVLGKNGKS